MGTAITLDLAGMTITYSKNHMGLDHGSLFQGGDRKPVRSDQVNYEYFEEHGEDPTPMEMAFVRKLKDVLPRLDLLGFTREEARLSFDEAIKEHRENSNDEDPPIDLLTFEEFSAFVAAHAIDALDDTYSYDSNRSDEQIKGRFANDPTVRRIPKSPYSNGSYSERSYFGDLVGIIHPYCLLHVLAGNANNNDADLVWQYGPLVVGGYAAASEFMPCARRTQTFLIATEGSSDIHILNRALQLLRPDVQDFFRFIDVSERHPFSGTGSLANFAEGLTKIDVQNQAIFVFDNDAEGYDAYEKVRKFNLPANMRTIMLPELDEFRSFPARGPNGLANADINKRAAAIECYLDLTFIQGSTPHVVWTNYKKDLDIYHGALEGKESHCKAFLKKATPAIANGTYDVSKLKVVLDALITECSSIAQTKHPSAHYYDYA